MALTTQYISTAKYDIPHMSILDQRRIQNLVKHLT